MNKKLCSSVCLILVLCTMLTGVFVMPVSASTASISEVENVAYGIINWKKTDVGSGTDGYLINDTFLLLAGTTPGDWYPIGLGRLGVVDNQSGYLAVINDNVQKRYQTADKLSRAKATEWHRISLAVLASGGNPRRMGEAGDIDLIADGTYNRVDENGNGILGKQGINGFIWGLIVLDSMYYEIPDGAYYTRDDIILNILNRQLSDGGWALSNGASDPDITAMAIQALAPYYNSEKEYTYSNPNLSSNGNTITKKVRDAVDEALECLSDQQMSDGGFSSWGMPNSESAVQVAVALTSLGIDIFSDTRFIKDGNTVYDGILKYRNSDGGFLHSFVYDAENPSALPDQSNTMASEQALYGMVAIIRQQSGMRRLYDFRAEQSNELKAQIKDVEIQIANLSFTSSVAELKAVYDEYLKIDSTERSYVYNYYKLSEMLSFAGIPYAEEKIEYNSGDAGVITPIEEFTDVDKAAVDALPEKLTTAYRSEVLRLWSKIRNSFDFEGKQSYYIKLEKAKNEIESIQAEIETIKAEIKEKLYPFDSISLSDRATVHGLYDRYMALSEYDRSQFEPSDIEGLLKSKTQVDNLYLAVWISGISVTVAVIVTAVVIYRIKKRRKERAMNAMPESEE